ncbi:MAG: hypothetical protein AVDCRST_MAG90-120, partial [uncultured Microvirga sp.]
GDHRTGARPAGRGGVRRHPLAAAETAGGEPAVVGEADLRSRLDVAQEDESKRLAARVRAV